MSEDKSHKHPDWVKVRYKPSKTIDQVEDFLLQYHVHTVCSSALCPNRGQCFNQKAMTFLILGPHCTRQCSFCSVDKKEHKPYMEFDRDIETVLLAIEKFSLRYITLTSPTRDDLPDGGAQVYASLIKKIRSLKNPPAVEALIPDFHGDRNALDLVLDSEPEVIAHNLETVPRLYIRARKGAEWERSLEILRRSSEYHKSIVKSAFIIGLGETLDELYDGMREAKAAGCEIMVIGQYLRPTDAQMQVERFVTPDEFREIEREGKKIGFSVMLAGPLFRSSFRAEEAYLEAKKALMR